MLGQPTLLTRDQAPPLLIGGLEFAPEARELHPKMATYLSKPTQRKFNDLLTNKQASDCYRLLQQDNKAAWGFRNEAAPAVSLGAVGLATIEDEALNRHLPASWKQVESWLTLFDPEWGGRGIASRAYRHMICMGLAMGVDVFYAPIRVDNEKSRLLHESIGFVTIGAFIRDEQAYIDTRLYSPLLRGQALTHAANEALTLPHPLLNMAGVDKAFSKVETMQHQLSYVEEAVEASADTWAPFMRSVAAAGRMQ